ncbi:MAG: insecticidal toxin protein [Planctomycetota bacterium]
MNKQLLVKAETFHGHHDTELVFHPGRIIETRETKYFVIQERELAYRFYLHQHPYVQPLTQRLLRKGTRGLQAADTEYAAGEISLPYGVDVEVGGNVQASVSGDARIGVLDMVTATGAGGVQMDIAKGTELKLAAVATASVAGGTAVTLVEYVQPTPYPRVTFTLAGARQAAVSIDTPIQLSNATQVALPDGTAASIPAGTTVVLAAGTEIGLPGAIEVKVLRRRMRPVSDLYADFFEASYSPAPELVRRPYPAKDLDFSSAGAYSVYNWELFYHVPITIAIHLSKNQRFAEAQRWFHYLFDPTDDSEGPTPERFWKVRPFQYTDVHKIEEILVNLATGADAGLRNETIRSIEAWQDAPFRPHVVARYRQQAYMYKTVMAYLDNLVAWGDSLFRQDTGEAIDEALMLYVLAANILGPKPLPVPKKGTVRRQTYDNLRNDLEQFGTVMRDMEPEMPFDLMPFPAPDSGDNARLATLRGLGKALYFCVPRNDKLLGYWDTVADRLFKIRNSLNIQGVFRQLALFDPPIDPAMLARAAAAGLDVGAIVNGLNQPLPLVRFALLVQKAAEIVQEVKSLGNSLLSAMEKEDGEAMALLRSKHERSVMDMVEHVRYGQLQEAIKSKEGLLQTLALAVQRYTYYQRQLGKKTDEVEKAIPELGELDKDSLDKMKLAIKEPIVGLREIGVDIAQDLGESGGKIISSHEADELSKLSTARDIQDAIRYIRLGAQGLGLIPDFSADLHFWGMGGHTDISGGTKLSHVASFAGDVAAAIADRMTYEAGTAAKIGSYARREQDWTFQANLAAGEINQIFKQIRAAEIREAITEQELKSHRLQMKHAEEIERFLNEEGTEKRGKKTNKALYAWMKREIKGLYSQAFQFAFDTARKAERALQHELGNPDLSYLQFGYLAGKEGLLAGEKLYLDVKRMEMAYHEQNQRELELTKHVSVLQVDPLALVQLRATGRCTLRLPESLFDMDGPGHYFRRIKTVAVSIPCVSGPYASVNCTLTLLKSSIRKTAVVGDQYGRIDANDDRFSDHYGSLQSIVTSSAQNDSGLFETNLRDERYLPFENSGAISEWQLQLPADPRKKDPAQFDYSTISDVILHVRYTARDGGGLLRNGAVAQSRELIAAGEAAGSMRLFSVRHEFPAEWARFTTQVPPANHRYELKLNLRPEHYPFWSQGGGKTVTRVDVIARSSVTPIPASIEIADKSDDTPDVRKDALSKDVSRGSLLVGKFKEIPLPAPEGDLTLFLDNRSLGDLWIALTWGEA